MHKLLLPLNQLKTKNNFEQKKVRKMARKTVQNTVAKHSQQQQLNMGPELEAPPEELQLSPSKSPRREFSQIRPKVSLQNKILYRLSKHKHTPPQS